jgi:hypothetical protein
VTDGFRVDPDVIKQAQDGLNQALDAITSATDETELPLVGKVNLSQYGYAHADAEAGKTEYLFADLGDEDLAQAYATFLWDLREVLPTLHDAIQDVADGLKEVGDTYISMDRDIAERLIQVVGR